MQNITASTWEKRIAQPENIRVTKAERIQTNKGNIQIYKAKGNTESHSKYA